MNTAIEDLQNAWNALEACWTETRSSWNDPVAWRFERDYWESLRQAAKSAIDASEENSDHLRSVFEDLSR